MKEELNLYVFDTTMPIHRCSECGEFHERYRHTSIDYKAIWRLTCRTPFETQDDETIDDFVLGIQLALGIFDEG